MTRRMSPREARKLQQYVKDTQAQLDALYERRPELIDDLRRELAQPISEAIHEHDVHTVIASRSLRVLNPWAILSNADSHRRVA